MGLNKILWLSLRFLITKKLHLGRQNGPGSSETKKLLKIVSCQKIVLNQLDKVSGH
jgi:hypothetical protein